ASTRTPKLAIHPILCLNEWVKDFFGMASITVQVLIRLSLQQARLLLAARISAPVPERPAPGQDHGQPQFATTIAPTALIQMVLMRLSGQGSFASSTTTCVRTAASQIFLQSPGMEPRLSVRTSMPSAM